MIRVENAGIDAERFAYLVKARLEALGLSYRQAAALTGVSTRQISDVIHARPVGAGSTIMLAVLCQIDLAAMFSGAKRERLERLQDFLDEEGEVERFQTVTPMVSHEMEAG